MNKLLDRILRHPERVIVAFGLVFLALTILICTLWDESTEGVPAMSAASHPTVNLDKSVLIDLNSATVKELMILDGIGEVTANRIVEYREEHGAFKSVDELINIKGLSEKKIDAIRYYVICSEDSEPQI